MKLGISFTKDPLSLTEKSSNSLFFVFHLTGEKTQKITKRESATEEEEIFWNPVSSSVCAHMTCACLQSSIPIMHPLFFFDRHYYLHLISTQNNLCTVYDMLPLLMKGEKKTENAREQEGKFHILKRTIQHLHDAN